MKKTLFALLAIAAAVPALACDETKPTAGFACANRCPLAQKANTHRSTGRESMAASATVRAAVAAQVERNLARI